MPWIHLTLSCRDHTVKWKNVENHRVLSSFRSLKEINVVFTVKGDHRNLLAVMSSEEKGVSPAHRTSTLSHKSASTSSSSQRESRQVSIRVLYCLFALQFLQYLLGCYQLFSLVLGKCGCQQGKKTFIASSAIHKISEFLYWLYGYLICAVALEKYKDVRRPGRWHSVDLYGWRQSIKLMVRGQR